MSLRALGDDADLQVDIDARNRTGRIRLPERKEKDGSFPANQPRGSCPLGHKVGI
jgi:hypothetical protein